MRLFLFLVIFLSSLAFSKPCNQDFVAADNFSLDVVNNYLKTLDGTCDSKKAEIRVLFPKSLTVASVGGQIFVQTKGSVQVNLSFTNDTLLSKPTIQIRPNGGDFPLIEVDSSNFTLKHSSFYTTTTTPRTSGFLRVNSTAKQVNIINNTFNLTSTTNVALDVHGRNVLIQNNYFRSNVFVNPSTVGADQSLGLYARPNADSIEVRTNVFFNSGIISITRALSVVANTFIGGYPQDVQVINVVNNATTPNRLSIYRNLFALRNPDYIPINPGTPVKTDKIVENQWNTTTTIVSSQGSFTGSLDSNEVLPQGLADFQNSDFPLVELWNDTTLEKRDSVWKLPSTYTYTSKKILSDLNSLSGPSGGDNWKSFSFFSSIPLLPANQTWAQKIYAGAIGDRTTQTYPKPSPLKSLAITLDATSKIKFTRTALVYDTAYYQAVLPPSKMRYFASKTEASLVGTYAQVSGKVGVFPLLKSGTNQDFEVADVSFDIPYQLRDVDNAKIYIRAFSARGTSPNYNYAKYTPGEINGTLPPVPKYPIKDFSITLQNIDGDNLCAARVVVSAGVEAIDSVRIKIQDNSKPTAEVSESLPFSQKIYSDLIGPGPYTFTFTPVGKGGAIGENSTQTFTCRQASDTVYVRANSCVVETGAGSNSNPYCGFSKAFETNSRPKTVVLLDTTRIDNLTIENDNKTQRITLVSFPVHSGDSTNFLNRKIFGRVIVNRPNVTLKGFVFEMGSSANSVTINAPGAEVLRNLFRPQGNNIGSYISTNLTNATDSVLIASNMFQDYGGHTFSFKSGGTHRILNNTIAQMSDGSTGTWTGPTDTNNNLRVYLGSNHFWAGVKEKYSRGFNELKTSEGNLIGARNAVDGTIDSITGFKNQGYLNSFNNISLSFIADVNQMKFFSDRLMGTTRCSNLWSAAASGNFSYPIDFFGTQTKDKREVGAFEYLGSADLSCGLLTGVAVDNNKVSLNIKSQQFKKENNDILVWWKEGQTSPDYDASLTTKKSFDLETLTLENEGVNLSLTVDSLGPQGNKTFTFCMGIGNQTIRNPIQNKCVTITTPSAIDTLTCALTGGVSRCPSGSDQYAWIDPIRGDSIFSWIEFPNKIDAVTLQPVKVVSKSDVSGFLNGFTLIDTLPLFGTEVLKFPLDSLDKSIKITLSTKRPISNSNQLHLVRISPNTGAVHYIPNWNLTNQNGNSTLVINDRTTGLVRYAFVETPKVATPYSTSHLPLTFSASEDKATVKLKLNGDFKTANPLVMVFAVPAGSIMKDRPFTQGYFAPLQMYNEVFNQSTDEFYKNSQEAFYTRFNNATVIDSSLKGFGKVPVSFPSSIPRANISVLKLDTLPNGSAEMNLDLSLSGYAFDGVDDVSNSKRKRSRSIEVVVAVYEAGTVRYDRVFVPVKFNNDLDYNANPEFSDKASFKALRWHLFSYPWLQDSTNNQKHHLFAGIVDNDRKTKYKDKNQRIYYYTQGSYKEVKITEGASIPNSAGKAIWVAVDGDEASRFQPLTDGGTSLDTKNFVLNLEPGWNQFGLPFNFSIKNRDIVKSDPTAAMYRWNKDWNKKDNSLAQWVEVKPNDLLNPWEGYVIFAKSPNQSIEFPVLDFERSTSAPLSKVGGQSSTYSLHLSVQSEVSLSFLELGKGSTANYLRQAPLAPMQDFSAYAIGYDSERNKLPLGRMIKKAADKSLDQFGEVWEVELVGAPNQSFSLSLDSLVHLPDSFSVVVVDPITGQTQSLVPHKTVNLNSGSSGKALYKVMAGSADYLSKNIQANLLSLQINPNPFRTLTYISYQLSTQEFSQDTWKGEMRILNLQGKTIYTSKLQTLKDRIYTTEISAQNLGTAFKSGVYIVDLRLQSASGKVYKDQKQLIKIE